MWSPRAVSNRWLFLVLTASVLVLLAASCSNDDTAPRNSDEPIRIGWVGPLTAGAAAVGNEMLAAANVAVDEINAEGGVLGRPVELVTRDTMADPEAGTTAMGELIDEEGVAVVIGEVHSSVAVAEIEVAHDRGVPFIVADAWADEITAAQHGEVFRIAPVNSLIYEAVGMWLQSTGFDDVVIVAETTAFGTEASALLDGGLSSAGAAVTVIDVDAATFDIDDVVGQIADGSHDLVMILIASDTVYPLITAVCQAGLAPSSSTALYVGAGEGVTTTFWDQVGSCGNYVIAEHLVVPQDQWNDAATALATALDAPDGAITSGGFAGYDAVLLAADAIERAGSTDAADVVSALRETDMVGARGQYTFSADTEPAWHYQQFLGAPVTVIQYSLVGETPADAIILAPDRWATADEILTP
jgi:branched-chain amino acid transport system substrate-binding protein